MAKKKPSTGYTDRKYNYPKGYTVDGKKKTGFMPSKLGAKVFVSQNLDNIKKGIVSFESLTTREKRVYRGKTSNTLANTYQFAGKRYYDPTGTLRKILDNVPALKDKRNLTNLLPADKFKSYFDQRINPTTGKQKLKDLGRSKWLQFSSSLYDFAKGDKKQFYRDESGSLMDIVTKLSKAKKSGREIRVIDTDGKIYTGTQAIEAMREFESLKLEKAKEDTKEGQQIQLQIVYLSTDYNPYTQTVTYNLNNVQVNDLNQTP